MLLALYYRAHLHLTLGYAMTLLGLVFLHFLLPSSPDYLLIVELIGLSSIQLAERNIYHAPSVYLASSCPMVPHSARLRNS